MNDRETRAQAGISTSHIKVAGLLWVVASMIIMISAIMWIITSGMTSDYFSSSKAIRDAAEAGSPILAQLQSIEAINDWVLPFAFVGLGTYLLGFGFGFANILRNVRLRGDTLAATLPQLKERKPSKK